MATAIAVARHILSLMDPTAGDLMSNLRLQKLLYYSQGFHLALIDKPLFNEDVEAWENGPVCPYVYHKFKQFGEGPIPIEEAQFDENEEKLNREEASVVEEVYNAYGQYSAWALKYRTNQEPPWLNNKGEKDVIPHKELKSFFLNLIEN